MPQLMPIFWFISIFMMMTLLLLVSCYMYYVLEYYYMDFNLELMDSNNIVWLW